MKLFKKVLLILCCLIVVILSLFIINYLRLTLSYFIQKNNYTEMFAVLGNTSQYVPQGIAYSEKYNIVLQTSYHSNHDTSKLYIIDFSTGELLKELKLIEIDDTNNVNHVGGITTDENTVWITNDYEVNEYSLDEMIETTNTSIRSLKRTNIPNRGDFCYYYNNILWIGDFYLKYFYPLPNDTPLLMGYSLENTLDYSTPDYIISLPRMVQGMAITSDNKFIFSSSFSHFIQSNLAIYDNVLNNEPDYYFLNGQNIPYYHFDQTSFIKTIKFPPMMEELFLKDNELYILFESSSDRYLWAYPKMNKIIKYNIEKANDN